MQLNNGKSPGLDGLVSEFYKVFKDVLAPILKDIFEVIYEKKEATQLMRIGLVKLIYKKKGGKNDLINYRPLTMLNTDFKVLAKVLANRLKMILPNIIKTTQAYAVKGKDITDITSSIRDIIQYMKEEKKEGYIISVDFEKAFDRVEHTFLFGVLKKFGFGENFLRWMESLYNGAMSCVKCNGFITEVSQKFLT